MVVALTRPDIDLTQSPFSEEGLKRSRSKEGNRAILDPGRRAEGNGTVVTDDGLIRFSSNKNATDKADANSRSRTGPN
jgi:hypothetical protein